MAEHDRSHDDDYLWDPAARPDPEIAKLERSLRPLGFKGGRPPQALTLAADRERDRPAPAPQPQPAARPSRRPWARPWMRPALAAAALVVVALGGWRSLRAPDTWRVVRLAGAPVVSAGSGPAVHGSGELTAGNWLETDARSAARVDVGRIGTAEIGPNSRLRLVSTRGTEHRLELARGTLQARIWAPPRFFLVETPAALAVDLGCVYELAVDEHGAGALTVTAGEVELVSRGRRSLVVEGTSADMRPGFGPGTPYPSASAAPFRAALDRLDFGPPADSLRAAALALVLRDANGRSTITLWHLLPRVTPAERALVYDRLAALARPPAGVTRDGVVRLDPDTMERWGDAIDQTWSAEPVPLWKRAWRWMWR